MTLREELLKFKAQQERERLQMDSPYFPVDSVAANRALCRPPVCESLTADELWDKATSDVDTIH